MFARKLRTPGIARPAESMPKLDSVRSRLLSVLAWPMPGRAQRRELWMARARLRRAFAAYGRVMRATGVRRQQLLGGVTALVSRAGRRLPGALAAACAPADAAAWALAAYDAAPRYGTRRRPALES